MSGERALALFYDASKKRPRALVRLVVHFVVLAIAITLVSLIAPALPNWLFILVDFFAVVAVTWAAARFLDRRSFVDLGLRVDARRARDLVAGVIVGAASIALVLALELALGVSRVTPIVLDEAHASSAAAVAWFFVIVAIQEEVVFRGYHVVNLTEGLTNDRLPHARAAMVAVVISSGVFGLAHATNSGATLLSTINIAVGGGFLLAVGFVITGELAFSIGLHFAWNLGQALLGMSVSGIAVGGALVTREVHGADWLTGGPFGPEGGILGLAGMLFGAALSIAYGRAAYGRLEVRLRAER